MWTLIPNMIDYLRLIMGIAPVFIPNSYYKFIAFCYLFSQFLDQVDGRVARYINQLSDFGMMLDYATDIITQAAFFMKMCSIEPNYVAPCAIIVCVESAGLVLAVHASASGRYWKNTDSGTPKIFQYIMKDGKYTLLGDSFVFGHQIFVTLTFLSLFISDSSFLLTLWYCFLPVSIINFWANSNIVFELLRKWEEPKRD